MKRSMIGEPHTYQKYENFVLDKEAETRKKAKTSFLDYIRSQVKEE